MRDPLTGQGEGIQAWWRRVRIAPADITGLALFRIGFGACLLAFPLSQWIKGRIGPNYAAPLFRFTYYGFDWVRPLPEPGTYVLFAALIALGAAVMAGYRYRLSLALYLVGFVYLFLVDASNYLNHLYLAALCGFILLFLPAHRSLSLDVLRKAETRATHLPAWGLWWLRAQFGIVYLYSGFAKLNGDWLSGRALGELFAMEAARPVPGLAVSLQAVAFSWAGLALDLAVVPALLWRRTRPFALVAAVLFHGLSAYLFFIGIFPWMMLCALLLFVPPEWFRRGPAVPVAARLPAKVPALAVAFLVLQAVIPLRHLLYPGDVEWTQEGRRFSWRMLQSALAYDVGCWVRDPGSGRVWPFDLSPLLGSKQAKALHEPDHLLQLAREVRRQWARIGVKAEVRFQMVMSVNGGLPSPFVDPTADLAAAPRDLRPKSWILRPYALP